MKPSLVPGLRGRFTYRVPTERTVPHLYPEAADFQLMPEVLATGYLVGLCEWACIDLIRPHLDWPAEQSLGTLVNFSHVAATPPGMTVTVETELVSIEGRKLGFKVVARDDLDLITEGTHERHIIDAARFNAKVADKLKRSTA